MEDKNLSKIKEAVQKILDIIGFEGEVFEDGQEIKIKIINDEARYLIGRSGENLGALQHLLRSIAAKQQIVGNFLVDVNDYQKNRLEELREAAMLLADEVVRCQSERRLPPMNSYERRIVHMALKGVEGIATESEGDGEERRIVVRPAR